jgi:cytochrome c556
MAVALAVIGMAVLSSGRAGAQDGKTPTIKDVMDALHKGAKSPLAQVKAQLKADAPDWAEIKKTTKQFVEYGTALAKNTPPKGDPEAFKALATAYATSARALDEAAQKEDLPATKAAFAKIASSCKSCHAAHKGE